ncbi:MAG TPA: hypothetical protein VHF46_02900 [Rubrobacteraceae bacterium]|nr:hypothetical protein [Rubrobacteraceae bacterium]
MPTTAAVTLPGLPERAALSQEFDVGREEEDAQKHGKTGDVGRRERP